MKLLLTDTIEYTEEQHSSLKAKGFEMTLVCDEPKKPEFDFRKAT